MKNLVYVSSRVNEIEEQLTCDMLATSYPELSIINSASLESVNGDTVGIFIEASAVNNFKVLYEKLVCIPESVTINIRFLSAPLRASGLNDISGPSIYDIADQFYIKSIADLPNAKLLFPFPIFVELGSRLFENSGLFPLQSIKSNLIINPEVNITSTLEEVTKDIVVNLSVADDPTTTAHVIKKLSGLGYNWTVAVTPEFSAANQELIGELDNIEDIKVVTVRSSCLNTDNTNGSIQELFKTAGAYLDLNRYSRFTEDIPSAQSYGCLYICLNDNVLPYSERAYRIPYNDVEDKLVEHAKDILQSIYRNPGMALENAKKGQIYSVGTNTKYNSSFSISDILYTYYKSLIKSMALLDLISEEEDAETSAEEETDVKEILNIKS